MKNCYIKYWGTVVLYAAAIFMMSSFSAFPRPVAPLLSFDKLWHTLEYAILSFLLIRALKGQFQKKLNYKHRVVVFLIVVFYAFIDEFHQSFVPLRTMSFVDVCFDALGGIVGQMFYKILSLIKSVSSKECRDRSCLCVPHADRRDLSDTKSNNEIN